MSRTHLIILPCHSIWVPGPTLGISQDEWFLAPFQIEGKDHLCFREHIEISIAELANDPNSLLIISGGATKKEAGEVSEARSYFELAKLMFDKTSPFLQRIELEEYARDSFENVLFLICKFFESVGAYPTQITIVGFEFKRERFIKYHLSQALLFPESNIYYVGNSPDPTDLSKSERDDYFDSLSSSEYQFAVKHFQNDWYGLRNPLRSKRAARNPFGMSHDYAKSNAQLCEFLEALGRAGDGDEDDQQIRSLLKVPWIEN